MILSGIISYNQPLTNSKRKFEHSSIGVSFAPFGEVTIELFAGESLLNFNSIAIVSLNEDLTIDHKNSVLPSAEFLSYSDLSDHLTSPTSSIDLALSFCKARKQLFVSRGIFGNVPFYHLHIPQTLLAFSTSLTSLIQLKEVKASLAIDHSSVLNYLSLSHLSESYQDYTFFRSIKNILPGHCCVFDNEGIRSTPYIKFDFNKWSKLERKEEYGEAFRNLFKSSVERAILNRKLIGSELSGGLDSSSISCMVKQIHPDRPLHTFYGDTNTPDSNEHEFAQDVVQLIGSIHHVVAAPQNEIDKAILHTSICGNPLNLMHSPARQNKIIQAIKSVGCDTILSGEGGDGIVGYGLEYITNLISSQRWEELKTEFATQSRLIKQAVYHPNWPSLSEKDKAYFYARENLYRYLAQKFRVLPVSRFVALFGTIAKEFNISPLFFINQGIDSFLSRNLKKNSFITAKYKNFQNPLLLKSGTESLASTLFRNLNPDLYSPYGSLFNSISIRVREDRFALSNYYGLNTRFPFYDKSLLELSMSTPAFIKYDNGLRRGLIREAMKGILPESVRVRFGKAAFGIFARQSALRLYEESQDFLTNQSQVWDYIRKDELLQLVQVLKKGNQMPSAYTYFYINRTIFLAIWLDWLKRSI